MQNLKSSHVSDSRFLDTKKFQIDFGIPIYKNNYRNMSGFSVDNFKSGLDALLTRITDQLTVPGRQRSALTNSLIDQVVAFH